MGRAIQQENKIDGILIRMGVLESKVDGLCATLNAIIEHTERAMMQEEAEAEKKIKKSVKKDTNRAKSNTSSK